MAEGDDVVICGKVTRYTDKNGKHTFETVSGKGFVSSWNGQKKDPEEGVDMSKTASKTVAEFTEAANTKTYFKLMGTVSNYDKTNCTLDLTDDTGTISVAEVRNADDWKEKIKDGGIITLAGKFSAGTVVAALVANFETDPTLEYPDDDVSKSKVSSYTAQWQAVIGSNSWTITNFNNNNGNWDVIKCGRKNDPSVASISNNNAYTKAISKVVVTVSTLTAANAAKINSSKLYVSTSADFPEENTQTVSVVLVQGVNEFVVPEPTANCYYKLEFDCQKSANGFLAISKVEYVSQK